jgi:hypothetical protein
MLFSEAIDTSLRVDDPGKQFVHQISPSVRLSMLLSDDRQRWQLRARGAR